MLHLGCPNRAFRLRLGRTCLEQNNVFFATKYLQLVYPPLCHGPFNGNPCANLGLGRSKFDTLSRQDGSCSTPCPLQAFQDPQISCHPSCLAIIMGSFEMNTRLTGHWKATGGPPGKCMWKLLCRNLDLKGGLGPPDPPISSPKIFRMFSFTKSISRIINLCTPPMVGEIS